jgi:hypothetical protein
MVRYLTTALAFLLIAVATASGSASASDGEPASPRTDFAVGDGTYLLDLPEVLFQFRVHFSFSARALDAGPEPAVTGRFFWNDIVNDDFIRARVICLSVDGGEAFLVGEIVDSNDPGIIGLFAGAQVIDSGLPGAQGDRLHLES